MLVCWCSPGWRSTASGHRSCTARSSRWLASRTDGTLDAFDEGSALVSENLDVRSATSCQNGRTRVGQRSTEGGRDGRPGHKYHAAPGRLARRRPRRARPPGAVDSAELHRIARRRLPGSRAERSHNAPSSLVQEAFIRLLPDGQAGWHDRAHFFAVASRVMRHVLVDYARQKRCANAAPPPCMFPSTPRSRSRRNRSSTGRRRRFGAAAARRLRRAQEQRLRLRFFGGLSLEETAEALGVGARTVVRDWNFARAWLRRELTHGLSDEGHAAD